jgi:DNA-binding CsgD family transcriptional regulator
MTRQRKRSFSIHVNGLSLIEKRMKEKGYDRQQLAEQAELSIETINNDK